MSAVFPNGIYPTMITPYTKDNQVDYKAIDKIVEWYYMHQCDGIFAVCQSSELFNLTLEERVNILKYVKGKAKILSASGCRTPMAVIASGHVSDSLDEQSLELNAMYEAGADAVILLTNRLDIANTGDKSWIEEAEKLISKIPEDVPLGLYECPTPYKRLLTKPMIEWCINTGRFYFLKDTCCDANLINQRLKIISGSKLKLFNANAQTFLKTLQYGANGYCGIMANFHPDLYAWLYRNFEREPEKAEKVGEFLSLVSFTESLNYPITAKYHMSQFEGIDMELFSRVRDVKVFSDYDRLVIGQMKLLCDDVHRILYS